MKKIMALSLVLASFASCIACNKGDDSKASEKVFNAALNNEGVEYFQLEMFSGETRVEKIEISPTACHLAYSSYEVYAIKNNNIYKAFSRACREGEWTNWEEEDDPESYFYTPYEWSLNGSFEAEGTVANFLNFNDFVYKDGEYDCEKHPELMSIFVKIKKKHVDYWRFVEPPIPPNSQKNEAWYDKYQCGYEEITPPDPRLSC